MADQVQTVQISLATLQKLQQTNQILTIATAVSVGVVMIVIFTFLKNPELRTHFLCSLSKTPMYIKHYSPGSFEFLKFKRIKGTNQLEVPGEPGVYYFPSSNKIETSKSGNLRVLHGHNELSCIVSALEAAACNQLYDILIKAGFEPSDEVIYALLVELQQEKMQGYLEIPDPKNPARVITFDQTQVSPDEYEQLKTVLAQIKNAKLESKEFVWGPVKSVARQFADAAPEEFEKGAAIAEAKALHSIVRPPMNMNPQTIGLILVGIVMVIILMQSGAFDSFMGGMLGSP